MHIPMPDVNAKISLWEGPVKDLSTRVDSIMSPLGSSVSSTVLRSAVKDLESTQGAAEPMSLSLDFANSQTDRPKLLYIPLSDGTIDSKIPVSGQIPFDLRRDIRDGLNSALNEAKASQYRTVAIVPLHSDIFAKSEPDSMIHMFIRTLRQFMLR